ncbi:MAG TPA: acyltransferase [Pseudolabrys sp.]|nr:acyltransferase [Pseudolabrys sp.]
MIFLNVFRWCAGSVSRNMLNSTTEQMRRTPNNFGALRLIFAVLVILSHSTELVDGNRSREILTRIFGTLTFGDLGVDGFFLISGYLVTKSFLESRSAGEYFLKRVLRIYPGYVVAYLLCVLALGPFIGGQIAELSGAKLLWQIVTLREARMPGVFPGVHFPELNASMWTIKYEFLCYLLVLAAGVAGLLSKRIILVLLIVGSLVLSALHPNSTSVGFAGVFGCGALFYLYRDRIRYDWRLAILAACGLIVLLFSSWLATASVAVFGSYVLFWFAFNVTSPTLASVGQKVDISYGVYLYAWPVESLLIWLNPGISPWVGFIETTAISSLFAFGSWWLVEKPFLSIKTKFVPGALASGRKVP